MKFNVFTRKAKVVTNYQGAKAFTLSPEMELYSAVVTTSLEQSMYEGAGDRLARLQKLIENCNPYFVAKLAIYARTQMHLRSVPIVLVVELGKIHKGDNLVSQTLYQVIQRADEITETLAYYQLANDRTGSKKLHHLSKQIQKGIAMAFTKFDEYQFAKYNRKTEVTLKDALFLTHPKPSTEGMQLLFNKIVNNTLATPYTWEVELSAVGQTKFESAQAKKMAVKAKWEELIDSDKLGYMALMRNLCNILNAGVGAHYVEKVAAYLSNKNAVLKSKQLPFRFLSAYIEVSALTSDYAPYILEALEKAVITSTQNLKGFNLDTKVLIASDVSGSMFKTISKKSKIACYDIGLVLSMLLQSKCKNVVTGIFGDIFKTYSLPKSTVLQNTIKLKQIAGEVGYSTNGYKVLSYLIGKRMVVDKVMIFTDLQMWDSTNTDKHIETEWLRYKKTVAPEAKLYLFDLVGYGKAPLQVKKNGVYLIAGWSDKIFDVLEALENGRSVLSTIKATEINKKLSA